MVLLTLKQIFFCLLWSVVLSTKEDRVCFPCKLYGTCKVSSCLNCEVETISNKNGAAKRVSCKKSTCFKKCNQPCSCAGTRNDKCIYYLQQYPCLLHRCEMKCTEPYENRRCSKFCWGAKNCHMYCLQFPLRKQCRRKCSWKLEFCKRPCRPTVRRLISPKPSSRKSMLDDSVLQRRLSSIQSSNPIISSTSTTSVFVSPPAVPSPTPEESFSVSPSPEQYVSISPGYIQDSPLQIAPEDSITKLQIVELAPSFEIIPLQTSSPTATVSTTHTPSSSISPTESSSSSSSVSVRPSPIESSSSSSSVSVQPSPTASGSSSPSCSISPAPTESSSSSSSVSVLPSPTPSTSPSTTASSSRTSTTTPSPTSVTSGMCKTNSTLFVLEEWQLSGPDVLNGSEPNSVQDQPFPINQYNGLRLCNSDLILTGVLHASQGSSTRSQFTSSSLTTGNSNSFAFSFSESTTSSNESMGSVNAIEVKATKDIADLSVYGIEIIMNGTKSMTGREVKLVGTAKENEFLQISFAGTSFQLYFGFPPRFSSTIVDVDGDDVVLLYKQGKVIDSYGFLGEQSLTLSWGYRDGWAYRKTGNN